MIAVKLSVRQPIEALKGLTEKEKREALNKDLSIQEADLTSRYREAINDGKLFEQGKLTTYSLSDLLDEL